MITNPFEEVENGVRSGDLSAFHPYWENFVKLSRIDTAFKKLDKLNKVRDNEYLFQREFSKNTSIETIENEINQLLDSSMGAMNSLNYICKLPCGRKLIN